MVGHLITTGHKSQALVLREGVKIRAQFGQCLLKLPANTAGGQRRAPERLRNQRAGPEARFDHQVLLHVKHHEAAHLARKSPRREIGHAGATHPLHDGIHGALAIVRKIELLRLRLEQQLSAGITDQKHIAVHGDKRRGALVVEHAAIHELHVDVAAVVATQCNRFKNAGHAGRGSHGFGQIHRPATAGIV